MTQNIHQIAALTLLQRENPRKPYQIMSCFGLSMLQGVMFQKQSRGGSKTAASKPADVNKELCTVTASNVHLR